MRRFAAALAIVLGGCSSTTSAPHADLATPDFAIPDLATPDLSAMIDLSTARDLSATIDLSTARDLSTTNDFSTTADLTTPIDLATPHDLRICTTFGPADVASVPPSYDFGDVPAGTSASITLAITNHGSNDAPLFFDRASPKPPYSIDASQLDSCDGLLQTPGNTCHVTIDFAPTSAGKIDGTYELDVGCGDPLIVPLTGKGT